MLQSVPARDAKRLMAIAVGMLWLCLMGGLIWLHAQASNQPPIHDAFTYFFKAREFWNSVHAGHLSLQELIATEPSFRPVGTVLMSYPFGFSMDFHGFYFRSTFFPVALVFVATVIVGWRKQNSSAYVATTILSGAFLATLPVFFYFDIYRGGPAATSHWGLVDGFTTGIAALMAACAVRSVLNKSVGWGIISTLLGVVSIYVKPTGVLLAASVGTALGIAWLWTLKEATSDPGQRNSVIKQIAVLFPLMALLLGGAVWLATHSAYLGPGNMMYGNAAIQIMRAELQADYATLIQIAYSGLGPFIPVWLLFMVLVWTRTRLDHRVNPARAALTRDNLLMFTALLILTGGVWFWLFGSGGQTQVRYFTPFLYVAIFFAAEPFLRSLESSPKGIRWFGIALMLCGVVNNLLLLSIPDPALAWQIASGVNVKSGVADEGRDQARALIAQTAPTVSKVSVYSIDFNDASYQSIFDRYFLTSEKPRFTIQRPTDWQRPSTFRVDEIVSSDYILFDPYQGKVALPHDITNLQEEHDAFHGWTEKLTKADGVEPVIAGDHSTLLRIIDPAKLQASLDRFVAAHHWRDVFYAENAARWWSDEEIKNAIAGASNKIENVKFDDTFFMRAVVIDRAADGSIEFRAWLRPLIEPVEGEPAMLVHLVDDKGDIIINRDVWLGKFEEATAGKPYRFYAQRFAPPPNVRRVAFGIYRGQSILAADSGDRDWGGRRILLPMPQSAP